MTSSPRVIHPHYVRYYTHYKWPPYSGGGGAAGGRYNKSLPSMYNVLDLSNGTTAPRQGAYSGVCVTLACSLTLADSDRSETWFCDASIHQG